MCVVNLFMNFVISILLKLALTLIKDVFRYVIGVKCKKLMVLCFISVKWHINVLKANRKAKQWMLIFNKFFFINLKETT